MRKTLLSLACILPFSIFSQDTISEKKISSELQRHYLYYLEVSFNNSRDSLCVSSYQERFPHGWIPYDTILIKGPYKKVHYFEANRSMDSIVDILSGGNSYDRAVFCVDLLKKIKLWRKDSDYYFLRDYFSENYRAAYYMVDYNDCDCLKN